MLKRNPRIQKLLDALWESSAAKNVLAFWQPKTLGCSSAVMEIEPYLRSSEVILLLNNGYALEITHGTGYSVNLFTVVEGCTHATEDDGGWEGGSIYPRLTSYERNYFYNDIAQQLSGKHTYKKALEIIPVIERVAKMEPRKGWPGNYSRFALLLEQRKEEEEKEKFLAQVELFKEPTVENVLLPSLPWEP